MALGSVLLMGCGAPEYTLIVDNQSSHDVVFTMTIGYSVHTFTLAAGDKYIHPNSIPEALRKKERMENYEPKQYVNWNYSGDIYTFTDIPIEPIPEPEPIPIFIFNTLSKDVIISGNGALSTDPITIKAKSEVITETVIKNNPTFNAKTIDGYPVQVDCIFDEDESKYMMTLR